MIVPFGPTVSVITQFDGLFCTIINGQIEY